MIFPQGSRDARGLRRLFSAFGSMIISDLPDCVIAWRLTLNASALTRVSNRLMELVQMLVGLNRAPSVWLVVRYVW